MFSINRKFGNQLNLKTFADFSLFCDLRMAQMYQGVEGESLT